jgi:hypothetical protein
LSQFGAASEKVKSGKIPSASEYCAMDPRGMTKKMISHRRPGRDRR